MIINKLGGKENPGRIHEKSLHLRKVTDWCALYCLSCRTDCQQKKLRSNKLDVLLIFFKPDNLKDLFY